MQPELTDESSLLRDFARSRNESAFGALVDRYISIVYAAANRQTGDSHLAEDVTQAVFILLARKASGISPDRPLSAWLLKTTSYCAANARRTRSRRQALESRVLAMSQSARSTNWSDEPDWQCVAPLLDEGLSRMRQKDRDVLLWRFIERRSVVQIAQALGISEYAASKRVTRAVDRLRDFFAWRGVTVTSATLATILVTKISEAAPAALTVAVSSATTVGAGTSAAVIANGALVMAATAKLKLTAAAAIAAALLIGGGATVINALASQDGAPASPAQTAAQTTARAERVATTAPAPGSLWFPDGTVVKVLGIAEGHDRGDKWWAADGSPVEDPNFGRGARVSVGAGPDRRSLQLILEITGQAAQEKTLSLQVPQTRGTAIATVDTPAGRRYKVAIALPAAKDTVDIRFGLAGGDWTETVLWENGAPAAFEPNNPAPKVVDISEANGETVLELVRGFVASRDDRRVLVIADGRTINSSGMNSDGMNETHKFRVAKDSISKVVFRSRPFEWQEMKNVSLVGK